MSQFVDQLLLQLSQAEQLQQLLTTTDNAQHDNMRFLLDTTYHHEFATIESIQSFVVKQVEAQRLLPTIQSIQGTWTQTLPGYTRTEVAYESAGKQAPLWLDLAAELELTLTLQVDPGGVESMVIQSVGDFQTLDEFKARFSPLDLTGFLTEHHITTVEQLREFQYLLAEVKLKQPPGPSDTANGVKLTLSLAILLRDTIDIAAALRDIKLIRSLSGHTQTFKREAVGGEVVAPYAHLVLFSRAALSGLPTSFESDMQALFKREGVLALFLSPT
jgi:hypothetical protein